MAFTLEVDPAASSAHLEGSLAFLPRVERVLSQQAEATEERLLNPGAAFDPPEPSIEVTPNLGRRGWTPITVRMRTSGRTPPESS